jgi:D-tagatose-1,6-bisphosphate aldolase subunit GatZ/KbaZ
MINTTLLDLAQRNRKGETKGIFSTNSTHPVVIKAYLMQAQEDGFPAVIEVSAQDFSDSRMTPNDLKNKIHQIAGRIEFPLNQLSFGVHDLNLVEQTDNNNPQVIIDKHRHTVLDLIKCSFNIFGLKAGEAINGELISLIEKATAENLEADKPVYVIDIPVEQVGLDSKETSALKERAANIKNLIGNMNTISGHEIKDRILAVRMSLGSGHDGETVFPFSQQTIRDFNRDCIDTIPNLMGAHNIDFQPQSVLNELVNTKFAYLRVGSELTYTMREAIFSLAMMENETLQGKPGVYLSNLMGELDKAMQSSPDNWKKYYRGNGFEQLLARKYSLHDRSRFFWDDEEVQEAWLRLFLNLHEFPIPVTVLRQYMPEQYGQVISGAVKNTPEALVLDKLRRVMLRYSCACGWRICK